MLIISKDDSTEDSLQVVFESCDEMRREDIQGVTM
jgi:hypothetical protein